MVHERRKHGRQAVKAPALFRTVNSAEGTGECRALSVGGVLVECPDVPPQGSELWVYFKLEGRQFLAPGVIVRTANRQFAIVFQEEPYGLANVLSSLEAAGRRKGRRVELHILARIRRESGETEVVESLDVSPTGFAFESIRTYNLRETVWVARHYQPEAAADTLAESCAMIVRAVALPKFDAFLYGLEFLSDS